MKNVYYIGRDESCDIILQDDSNVISRTHAILRVGRGGKYTISDQSMNGTYVNGIRISSGVEVPVSNKDIISFAHLVDFDWSLINNTRRKTRIIVFSIIGGLVLIGALCWGALKIFGNKPPVVDEPVIKNQMDSLANTADSTTTADPIPGAKNVVNNNTPPNKTNTSTVEEASKEVAEAEKETAPQDTVKNKKNINAIF